MEQQRRLPPRQQRVQRGDGVDGDVGNDRHHLGRRRQPLHRRAGALGQDAIAVRLAGRDQADAIRHLARRGEDVERIRGHGATSASARGAAITARPRPGRGA
jgi:hypothetical protein